MDFALPIAIVPIDRVQRVFYVGSRKKRHIGHELLDHFIPHSRNNYHPHIFSRRITVLLSMVLVAAKVFTIVALASGPFTPVEAMAITPANIISLTNQSRQGAHIPVLTEDNLLDAAAQSKANDMLAKGYFAHNTPVGQTPWDFITSAGYNYITAGENLAINFTQAENVETAWMNSPGHRANILNMHYQNIGVGIAQGNYLGHNATIVVQMFGTLADQKIVLNDQPTKMLLEPKTAPALAFVSQKAEVKGAYVNVSASLSQPAVKVLAVYSVDGVRQGIMLSPGPNNTWSGNLNLSDVTASPSTLVLQAYNMSGNMLNSPVADFAGSTPVNYNSTPQSSFNPTAAEQTFTLIFIATILTCLILAVGIKRHIQHLSLIANGSFVVILAVMLWVR